MTSTESRRARQRRELVAEIKSIARRQLEAGGRAGVSWRAIAREVGLNPASLYTYFPSLDDLFTALLLDSYGDLAAATEHAATRSDAASPTARTIDIALAYRAWARAHPAQYNLLFTDQIPGYAAPPGGPTVAAQTAVFEPMLAEFRRLHGGDPSEAFSVAVFATLHGLVSLEINHHLDWIDGDHESLLRERFERLLAEGVSTAG
ncbi:MAG: TetR/AcrR family transcriptional regulator [Actinomycetota bacterium]